MTKLELANQALLRVGADITTDLSGTDRPSVVANTYINSAIKEVVLAHKFSSVASIQSITKSSTAGDGATYTLPSNVVKLHRVFTPNTVTREYLQPYQYNVNGFLLETFDVNNTNLLIEVSIVDTSTTSDLAFDEHLNQLVVLKLASKIAPALTLDQESGVVLGKEYAEALQLAVKTEEELYGAGDKQHDLTDEAFLKFHMAKQEIDYTRQAELLKVTADTEVDTSKVGASQTIETLKVAADKAIDLLKVAAGGDVEQAAVAEDQATDLLKVAAEQVVATAGVAKDEVIDLLKVASSQAVREAMVTADQAVDEDLVAASQAVRTLQVASDKAIDLLLVDAAGDVERAAVAEDILTDTDKVAGSQVIETLKVAADKAIDLLKVAAGGDVEQAAVAEDQATDLLKVAAEQVVATAGVAKDEVIDLLKVASSQAVREAMVTADQAVDEDLVAASQAVRTLQVASDKAIDLLLVDAGGDIERAKVAEDILTDTDKVAASQAIETLKVTADKAVDIQKVFASQDVQTQAVSADQTIDLLKVASSQTVETSSVAKDKAIDLLKVDASGDVERSKVAEDKLTDLDKVDASGDVERAKVAEDLLTSLDKVASGGDVQRASMGEQLKTQREWNDYYTEMFSEHPKCIEVVYETDERIAGDYNLQSKDTNGYYYYKNDNGYFMQKYDFDTRGLAWVISYGFSISTDSDVLFYQTPSNDDFPKLEQWYNQVTTAVESYDSIVVSGITSSPNLNGGMTVNGTRNGKARYTDDAFSTAYRVEWDGSQWTMIDDFGEDTFTVSTNPADTEYPPTTGWTVGSLVYDETTSVASDGEAFKSSYVTYDYYNNTGFIPYSEANWIASRNYETPRF